MGSQGGNKSEATKHEVVSAHRCTRRSTDAWRLQERKRLRRPTTPAGTTGPDRFDLGESELDSGGTIRASLTWQTSNATDVSIDGIGAVQPNGSQSVSPTDSTTYHLTAKGSGGTQEATARLTVTRRRRRHRRRPPSVTDEDLFSQNIKDVYFDYDKSDIRGDQQASVQADVAVPQSARQYEFHD